MQSTPQHPEPLSAESSRAAFSAKPSPQPPAKRPWLPLRHAIGLIAVFAFVVGGVASGGMILDARAGQMTAEAAALEAANSKSMFDDMTTAMLEGDRDTFVGWGKGDAQDQLARIWDETKKIGWTVGAAAEGVSEEALARDRFTTSDDGISAVDEVTFAFDLGFSPQRFSIGAEGPDANCVAGTEGCGILTQSFTYDVTVDAGDGSSNSHRIVELSPHKPMPWDDAAGVHAVRTDNAVVFGYADEAARVDEISAETQIAAAGVLQTEVAVSGYASVPGFPAFVSDNPDRYQQAVYGAGEHMKLPNREWQEAGVTIVSPPLSLQGEPAEAARAHGMLTELMFFGGQGASLPAFDGTKLATTGLLRVAAHEFAHALEMTTYSHSRYDEGDGSDIAASFGTEGFARYVEDVVAAPYDGVQRTLQPDVRDAIVGTSNDALQGLVGAEAFRASATSDLAYNASGNYFAFMAENGVDISKVMLNAEYLLYDPITWIGLHYPSTSTGERFDATPDAWRAWNARS